MRLFRRKKPRGFPPTWPLGDVKPLKPPYIVARWNSFEAMSEVWTQLSAQQIHCEPQRHDYMGGSEGGGATEWSLMIYVNAEVLRALGVGP